MPRELQDILTLGMAKEPEHRPSIREVHLALAATGSKDGAAAAQTPPRRPFVNTRAVAAGLAVVGGMAISYYAANAALDRRERPDAATGSRSTTVPPTSPAEERQAATSQVPAEPLLESALDDHALTVTNRSAGAVSVREISLGGEGSPSIASIGITLTPGESLMVPFDEFKPTPAVRTRSNWVKVVTDGPEVPTTIVRP